MKLIKIFVLLASALFAGISIAQDGSQKVFNLANGDRISGKLVSSDYNQYLVETQFGILSIPKSSVKGVFEDVPTAAQAASEPPPAIAQSASAVAQEIEAGEDPAAPTPVKKEMEWITDYRTFLQENLPEGWQFRLRGGVQMRETSSSSFSTNVTFEMRKEWELDKFYADAYYDYSTETSADDVDSTTLDKYGINTDYRHDFDKNTNWYMQNLLSYKVDFVKGIRDQVDEAVTVGYTFEFDRYDLVINIGPGPAIRYINAQDYNHHWVVMAVLAEDLVWKFSDIFRFEEKGYLGFNVTNPSEYSAYLKLALIAEVSEVMNIALRYSYEYDAINAYEAQKSEQTLLLSFEFPFNWKN